MTPHRIFVLADKPMTCVVQNSDWKEVRTIDQFRVGESADMVERSMRGTRLW